MRLLPQDERYLSRALELAREAAAFASPNPTVGCVLLRDERVLGEGAHRYDARDHAEIVALKQASAAGLHVDGATAFVTLEPCSHQGRTGPCSDALIAAGISRCVVATVDPNPQVSGKGIEKLRAAGVDVTILPATHPIAAEARRLNDAFAFTIQHGRPFVTLKAALSVDGKLAPPPSSRSAKAPHWLTGEAARADVQQLRHASDAILTGIGTVLADDPSLTDRTGLPRRRPLLRVVLDSDLRTPVESKLVTSAKNDVIIFCHPFASRETEQRLLFHGVQVVRLDGEAGQPWLPEVLATLTRLQMNSVLLEAGSRLNEAFLLDDLVERAILYFSETELGANAVPFAGSVSPYVLQQRFSGAARVTFAHGSSEDVRLTGYLHDPWANIA